MNREETIVEARGLTKHFGDVEAVSGMDFQVCRQECYGFLGPNGAGKTSTMRMIHCFSSVTSGDLKVFGLDVRRQARQIKSRLGVMPQEENLDPDLTVRENLLVYARYYRLPRKAAHRAAERLLDFIQLSHKRNVRIQDLSGGMKRRLLIARALIADPELVSSRPETHVFRQELRDVG